MNTRHGGRASRCAGGGECRARCGPRARCRLGGTLGLTCLALQRHCLGRGVEGATQCRCAERRRCQLGGTRAHACCEGRA
ncbi:hypothetical protein B0H12DRAFT_207555 [Mycena haematopus]|nr:hypothetical protein B0H12DRAFT_207555 [Mycena haematopus]